MKCKATLFILCLTLLGQGCLNSGVRVSEDPAKVGKGVSPSPQSFDAEHFTHSSISRLRAERS